MIVHNCFVGCASCYLVAVYLLVLSIPSSRFLHTAGTAFWSTLSVELDRLISNIHNWGQLWDSRNHRNNWQSMTIGDQSMPMFHDEVTHQIPLAMGSLGHPCSTIQGSARNLSLMRPGPFYITLLDQANNPCSTYCSGIEWGICI